MELDYQSAVLGTQLAEVLSVDIRPFDFTKTYRVYGAIYARDTVDSKKLFLYKRQRANSDHICGRGTLSLASPARAISAAEDFTVSLELKNASDNTVFIASSFKWVSDVPTAFDTCLSVEVKGKLGSATIYYAVSPVALRAHVVARLSADKGSGRLNLCGTVIAHYEDYFNFSADSKNLKDLSRIVLFEKTSDTLKISKSGARVPLSRPYVTVPAYSRLVIEANLWHIGCDGHKEQLVCGTVDFEPDAPIENKIGEEGHPFCLSILVYWYPPTKLSSILGMRRKECIPVRGCYIVEVHSLRIFSNQADGANAAEIYGTFWARDARDPVTLFNHEKDDPVPVSADNTVPLTGPSRSIKASCVEFELSLHSKYKNMEICHGLFAVLPSWDWLWYNKRMSAVIKGKHGYGVFHFTIFDGAVQANVEVTLRTGGRGGVAVYGSLVAHYGNYDYHCEYVKNNFQTVLFGLTIMLQPEGDMSADSKVAIPLSRYAVGVPDNSSLIIEANLNCSSELVSGKAKFIPMDSGEVSAHIGKPGGGIDVKVSWFPDTYHSPGMPPPELYQYTPVRTAPRKKKMLQSN